MVTNVMTTNVQYPKPLNAKIDIYCYCIFVSYPFGDFFFRSASFVLSFFW